MFEHRLDETLTLDLLAEKHADELFLAINRNREHLSAWMPWVPKTREVTDVLGFVRDSRRQLAENDAFTTVIKLKGAIVGVIGYHQIDTVNRGVSLGYWLAKEHNGRGIMTRCSALYVHHAFEVLNLNRIEIHCASGNTQSANVARRLGFTEEATLRQSMLLNGIYHDELVFGMLRDEWQNNVMQHPSGPNETSA